MDVERAIGLRRALRDIGPEELTQNEIDRLIEAMRLSTSCFNNQPWRVVIVREGKRLGELKDALTKGNEWARAASVIMAVTARPSDDCRLGDGRDYYLFDCGLAVGQMLLAATSMGIIAHPIAGYRPKVVRATLSVPDDSVIIALIVLGRPSMGSIEDGSAQTTERPERLTVGETFFMDRFGR